MSSANANILRSLPAVNDVLLHVGVRPLIDECGRETVLGWVRDELEILRADAQCGRINGNRDVLLDHLVDRLAALSAAREQTRFGPVINATGVILHTGLGRAPISPAARTAIAEAGGAGNVEIDLETTARRYRGHQLQPAWRTLTGCEDSLIVNNNAAATLLTLQALAAGREVVISRGQLIEIGGSFRLPEIFELSGAKLCEVGTTNRTRLQDYERAVGPETAAIML
ncbi:MAG: L-seryl-tRNA(Sec) selenium transferase, partial [Planctomycetes bacterium]|nr:L-seryl-tRNA(Sec) selenium transferase [Planctomycetota bacterium]